MFKVGETYEMSFIGDSELKNFYKVIRRTRSTITIISIKEKNPKQIRRKVSVYDGVEFVYPLGKFSMAPILDASRRVSKK